MHREETTAWVAIPQGEVTGRTVQALLLSLAKQITAGSMEKTVERMRIDPENRRILVQFKGEG